MRSRVSSTITFSASPVIRSVWGGDDLGPGVRAPQQDDPGGSTTRPTPHQTTGVKQGGPCHD